MNANSHRLSVGIGWLFTLVFLAPVAVRAFSVDGIVNTSPPVVQGKVTGFAVDASGNRFVCGAFFQAVDFNPGLGADLKKCNGDGNTFVTRYNANGTYAWTQTFGGSKDDEPNTITVSGSTVYVCGILSSSDAGVGGLGTVASAGSYDAFVLALDGGTGNALTTFGNGGVQKFGGAGFDSANALAVSGTALYVAGSFNSTNAGLGGPGAIATTGGDDGFVLALNSSTGAALTTFGTGGVQKFGGTNSDQINALAVFGGSVYAAGTFSSTNAGIGGTGAFQTTGGTDAFVVALNQNNGLAVTAFGGTGMVKFGGTINDTCTGMAFSGGNLYLTGYFNSSNAQFNATGQTYTPLGTRSGYVLAVNAAFGTVVSGFGTQGVQKLGGSGSDVANDVVVSTNGATVYVTGNLFSSNFGIGALGTVSTSGQTGSSDAFVAALNTTDGKALSTFGTGGIQTYGGLSDEFGFRLGLSGTTLYMAGTSTSDDAGVGGRGAIANSTFGGYVVPLNSTTGAAAFPVLPNSLTVGGVVGTAFNYSIVATPAGTAFTSGALPGGLSLNPGTGAITGIPTVPGSFPVPITVSNALGKTSAQLTINIITDQAVASYPPIVRGAVNGVAVDLAGNRYVCGSFSGTVDFNPSAGVDVRTANGPVNAFVTKYASNGVYAWTSTFGGNGTDVANGMAFSGGTLYVTGTFSSDNAALNGNGSISSFGQSSVFVFALNTSDGTAFTGFGSSGVVRMGGSGFDTGNAVAATASAIYVTGTFGSPKLNFNGSTALTNQGTNNVFILAVSAVTGLGIPGFATGGLQAFGGNSVDIGYGIAVNGTNLYVAGAFSSSNAAVGGTVLGGSAGGFDAFVLALNATSGQLATTFGSNGIQKLGGSSDDFAYAITTDASNVYIAGSFSSPLFGVNGAVNIAPAGGADAYVAALTQTAGTPVAGFGSQGIVRFGGTADDAAKALTLSGTTLYAVGNSSSKDASYNPPAILASNGANDAFVLALSSSSGAPVAAFGKGGAQDFGGSGDDFANGVAVSGSTIFVGGSIASSDAGIGKLGTFDGSQFGGFLLPLTTAAGSVAFPQITSPLSVFGGVGVPFTYSIAGIPAPTAFSATNLPPNLNFNSGPGTITGTPTVAGQFNTIVGITASNGSASALVQITIIGDAVAQPNPPVVQGFTTGVAVDGAGNKYVCGTFTGARDFNPGVGLDLKVALGQDDVYVTRFNADGSYSWTQTFGGTGDDLANGITVANGNVYVTGSFTSLNAGIGGLGNVAAAGNVDAFVIALDATTGAAVSGFGTGGIQTFTSTGTNIGQSITVSNSVIFAAGQFQGSNGGIGGQGTITSTGDGGSTFIVALSASTGVPVNGFGTGGVQIFGGSSRDIPLGIAATGTAVYVTGEMNSTDTGIGGIGAASATGQADLYLIALNPGTGAGLPGFGAGGIQHYGEAQTVKQGDALALSATTVYVAGTSSPGSPANPDSFLVSFDSGTGALKRTFGNTGVVTLGGSGSDFSTGVAVSGNNVFVSGQFDSANFGIGAPGTIGSSGSSDVFVAALDAGTGLAASNFGQSGVVRFGGSSQDNAFGMAAFGSSLFVAGNFLSSDATVNGVGTINAIGFGGFLLPLDAATGNVVPLITSPLTATGTTGTAFTYTITASNNPKTFTANPPSPLAQSGATISGILPAAGTYPINLSAANSFGSGPFSTLMLTVAPPAPAINSALTATGVVQVPFSYAVTATNTPTSFDATPLPPGLNFDKHTGILSGTPTTLGTYAIMLTASNFSGSGTANLTLTVNPNQPPVLTLTASQNPSQTNTPVTFTVAATDPDSTSLTYSVDFGDGTPPVTGTFAPGAPAALAHSFPNETVYTVMATISDGVNPAVTQSLAEQEYAPNSGAKDVPNISQGGNVTNPLDGLEIGVSHSDGGVIELTIDDTGLHRRAATDLVTTFTDFQGASFVVHGKKPVHGYHHHGVYVATVQAMDPASGDMVGEGRETLVIGASETGEVTPTTSRHSRAGTQNNLLKNAPSTAIILSSMKGKFIFNAATPDTVSFVGGFELPTGFNPVDTHDYSMGMGNIVINATVDGRGRGSGTTATLKSLKLKYKLKKGQVAIGGEPATVSATFSTKGMVSAGWDTEGISPNQPASVTRHIQVAFQLDGAAYESQIDVQYLSSKNNAFGQIGGRH